MAYADANELIADYLPEHTGNTAVAALIGRLIESTSRLIDTYCRRRPGYFEPALPPATQYVFIGAGLPFLQIPIHVVGTANLLNISNDFWEEGLNGWIYTKPVTTGYLSYNTIEPLYYEYGQLHFVKGAAYKVEAVWGYESTPADIKEATRQTVVALFERRRGILSDVSLAELNLPAIQLPPIVREMLEPYKRREFEIDLV